MQSVPRSLLTVCLLTLLATFASAADKPKPAPKLKPPQRQQLIDHGPFVTATIPTQWEEGGIVNKGIAVHLKSAGENPVEGGILFDTDTCRIAAGWVGGFVEFTKDWTSVRDSKSVKIIGTQIFGTLVRPGWSDLGKDANEGWPRAWRDPRASGFGPVPKDWLRYKGLFCDSDRVTFAYEVRGIPVLESPSLEVVDGLPFIVRTIEIGASKRPLTLLACERRGAMDCARLIGKPLADAGPAAGAPARGILVGLRSVNEPNPEQITSCIVLDAPEPSHWGVANEQPSNSWQLLLTIPASNTSQRFRVAYAGTVEKNNNTGPVAQPVYNAAPKLKATTELPAHAASPLWPQEITTAGTLGVQKSDFPYAVDTLTLPDDNPWHSWMRPGGFDFFTSDPTKAAVCNWSGDVWVVSGIDDSLKELKWRRIASGLFQPLGLKIVNDQIYVLGRDQVTHLVDLNGDGETDFYENFNNDVEVTSNFHEFAFDLQTDAAGNFYFSKAGPVKNGGQGFETIAANHGTIMKLSPDGKKLETFATGFRAPNGIGVGPDGQITSGDNEGSWVPKCRLAWVKPGGFYGVVPTSHRDPQPADYDRPLCWFPKNVDNSSGGQVWVTSDKWGPLKDRLLHLSYGTCSLFLVMKEDVNGQVQGGVFRFPLSFDSGIMRARFNPGDGQLYVAGLKGWQTSAGKDGCFQRVRFTGKGTPNLPTAIEAKKDGLLVTFSAKLNAEDANDVGSFSVERWNYLWSPAYGSKDFSVADPQKEGHDTVAVDAAKLQPDGKSVFLQIKDMRPAMQYRTQFNLTTAEDDKDLRGEIYHTVNVLSDAGSSK